VGASGGSVGAGSGSIGAPIAGAGGGAGSTLGWGRTKSMWAC
jgi:hypothetical protein